MQENNNNKETFELNQKNKALYVNICNKCGIANETQAADLLNSKGYSRYVNAQSIKNRFRSGSTRTDFFWHLLDATECSIEIIKKGELTRAELLAKIETLENEQDMFSNIHPQVDLQKKYKTLSQAFKTIQKTLDPLRAADKND